MAVPEPTPVELHVREEGTGPALVLLHGLGGDHTVWNLVIPRLVPTIRIIAPDLRGHGRSPAPTGSTYSFPELEGDLLHLLDSRSIPAAHVVGMSAGGFLGLWTAVRRPERLRTLVTVGGAAHCDAHTRAVARNWAEVYSKEGFDAYFLRLLKDLYYPDWVEAHLDRADEMREELRHQRLDGVLEWGKAIGHFDERPQLAKIRLPTLVIQGMDDHVIDPSHGRLLRQAIPGAELRLLPQTGHMVPVERPQETADAISQWVARAEEAAPAGRSES